MEKITIYFFLIIILTSCWKEEIPIDKRSLSNAEPIQVSLGSDYGNQVWFNLPSRTVVKINEKSIWDFAFKVVGGEVFVRLNTANAATALRTNVIELDDITANPGGSVFKADHPNGMRDSLSIGKISFPSNVIIINRGFSTNGQALGNWKIRFLSKSENVISFVMARMSGTDLRSVDFELNNTDKWNCYSIDSDSFVEWEPNVDWHLCFTQYSHVFYEPYQPYLVTGVLINSDLVQVAEVSNRSFEEVDLLYASGLEYLKDADIIGYDWKFYNFDIQLFTVEEKLFVINTISGDYFKLRFLDFYDDQGQRGAPKFDLVEL
jgi:hypothetical protein